MAGARQPGVAEVMGDVGTLVDDLSPQGWADALEPYLADPEMAARVGAAGRVRAEERFGMERTVARLEELYAELAARGRLPAAPGRRSALALAELGVAKASRSGGCKGGHVCPPLRLSFS